MKQHRFLFLLLAMVLMGWPVLHSQPDTNLPDILVSTDWLENNLSDPNLVILHYGKQSDFEKRHIPNARIISLKDLIIDIEQGLKHELPDSLSIERALRSWGINNDSKIIICHGDENALILAARLYFTMDYAGLGNRTAILNGGLPAWKKENRLITQEASEFKEGNIEIRLNKNILANQDWVYSNLKNKNVTIVDARPEELYSGNTKDHNASRNGHIEGAISIPFDEVSQDKSPFYFKDKNEIRQLFDENSISSGSTIVTYCGSGIWASQIYFAARLLGYNVRLYDASYQEWGNDDTLPISGPLNEKP